MWKPIHRVTADFELMITKTNWNGGHTGNNWQNRQRRDDVFLQYKHEDVWRESAKIVNQFSVGGWRWSLNRTLRNSVTKPHRDWAEDIDLDSFAKDLRNTIKEINGLEEKDLKTDMIKLWRRFWIPMRDREFGQFFESSQGIISDWKAGDVFYLDASQEHCGATVGENNRYTMLAEGLVTNLYEQFKKLV